MTWFEVAYAEPDRQIVLRVELEEGVSVGEIVSRSGLLSVIPEIDLGVQAIGIFGRVVTLEHRPQCGDRVEIYRPLQVEPRARRRERAARQSVSRDRTRKRER